MEVIRKEACGDMHSNLLPLSVGLRLIHWSRDHELLAWSRPGALWSICRIALLIVGIHSVYSCLMITACSTQDSNLIAISYYHHSYFCSSFSFLSVSASFPLSCIILLSNFHWIPLFTLLTSLLCSMIKRVSGRRMTVNPSRHWETW